MCSRKSCPRRWVQGGSPLAWVCRQVGVQALHTPARTPSRWVCLSRWECPSSGCGVAPWPSASWPSGTCCGPGRFCRRPQGRHAGAAPGRGVAVSAAELRCLLPPAPWPVQPRFPGAEVALASPAGSWSWLCPVRRLLGNGTHCEDLDEVGLSPGLRAACGGRSPGSRPPCWSRSVPWSRTCHFATSRAHRCVNTFRLPAHCPAATLQGNQPLWRRPGGGQDREAGEPLSYRRGDRRGVRCVGRPLARGSEA